MRAARQHWIQRERCKEAEGEDQDDIRWRDASRAADQIQESSGGYPVDSVSLVWPGSRHCWNGPESPGLAQSGCPRRRDWRQRQLGETG